MSNTSKIILTPIGVEHINVNLIDVDFSRNYSRDAYVNPASKAAPFDATSTMAEAVETVHDLFPGWAVSKGRPAVLHLTEGEQAKALKRRAAWHSELKASATALAANVGGKKFSVTPGMRVTAWEALYMTDGQYVVPTYTLVTCFRRVGLLHLVNSIRAGLGALDGTQMSKPITAVSCDVFGPLTEVERISLNCQENEKNDGFRKPRWPHDYVRSCRAIYRAMNGSRESLKVCRATWNTPAFGMCGFLVCDLDARYPTAGLMEAVLAGNAMPSANGEAYKLYSPLSASAETTTEQVVEAMEKLVTKGDRIMSKVALTEEAKANLSLAFRKVFLGVLKNDPSLYSITAAQAAAIDAAAGLAQPQVEVIVQSRRRKAKVQGPVQGPVQ